MYVCIFYLYFIFLAKVTVTDISGSATMFQSLSHGRRYGCSPRRLHTCSVNPNGSEHRGRSVTSSSSSGNPLCVTTPLEMQIPWNISLQFWRGARWCGAERSGRCKMVSQSVHQLLNQHQDCEVLVYIMLLLLCTANATRVPVIISAWCTEVNLEGAFMDKHDFFLTG